MQAIISHVVGLVDYWSQTSPSMKIKLSQLKVEVRKYFFVPCTSHPVHVSIQRILKLLTMNCPHLLKLEVYKYKLNQCDQNEFLSSLLSSCICLSGWLHTVHVRCITLTVLSSDAVRSDCPSPEKSTLLTVAVWALNTVLSPFLQVTGKKTMSAFNIYLSSNCNNLLVSDKFSIDQRYQLKNVPKLKWKHKFHVSGFTPKFWIC